MFFGLPFSIAIFYIVALAVAFLKDVLDLAFITSLPGIGTVLTFVFTVAIIVLIILAGLFSVIVGGIGPRSLFKVGGTIRRLLVILGGGLIEELPGINFLPLETATVVLVMYLHGKAYKKAQKKENKKKTDYVFV